MSNNSIWPFDWTLSSVTTPSQSGPESNGKARVLHMPQSSRTGASSIDSLMPYPGDSLVGVVPLSKNAVGVFHSPSQQGCQILKTQPGENFIVSDRIYEKK